MVRESALKRIPPRQKRHGATWIWRRVPLFLSLDFLIAIQPPFWIHDTKHTQTNTSLRTALNHSRSKKACLTPIRPIVDWSPHFSMTIFKCWSAMRKTHGSPEDDRSLLWWVFHTVRLPVTAVTAGFCCFWISRFWIKPGTIGLDAGGFWTLWPHRWVRLGACFQGGVLPERLQICSSISLLHSLRWFTVDRLSFGISRSE